ncbi:DeoR/GlpR family DNA-binding transcription regulator [Heyndrickxia ginsengihumi]|uniref:DeoR/GlpR family DNA-binding transcription regulator n=1 Tax=Heyndrickxia ginsengihumi TaxID=363870 RepID=UPI001D3A5ED4|nr:DeoR/GlpR family DNA-binding transcription regulator [Heyndrickxia ginsengihumi]MBE6183526.1 DeoR/GlpR transcriptional regulator [Bacillus sp. (in: firmicutes)]MCM3023230.1 DeoR/GlpR family DNA-binding transcription regulator [Heyndrickxia ginsengihumi]
MQPQERRGLILEKLKQHGKIDIDDLVTQLHVSGMTIRRDLALLEEEEKIIRTHGGAILKKQIIVETPFRAKEGKHSEQKKEIAQAAIGLLRDDSTIILDSGTTTLEIAKLLRKKQHLTIITNDIKIAAELVDSELKVIVAGGELQNTVGALFGPATEQLLKNVHVDFCFLGAHAVHLDAGLTVPTFAKASIKKLMIEAAETTWLVADSSKFHQISLAKVCDLSEIDGVITDHQITNELEKELKEHLEIIKVDGSGI